jgi:hypothetical protein
MNQTPGPQLRSSSYELRFEPPKSLGPALTFPCDAQGQVDLDALSEQGLNDYLFARRWVRCGTVSHQHVEPEPRNHAVGHQLACQAR